MHNIQYLFYDLTLIQIREVIDHLSEKWETDFISFRFIFNISIFQEDKPLMYPHWLLFIKIVTNVIELIDLKVPHDDIIPFILFPFFNHFR